MKTLTAAAPLGNQRLRLALLSSIWLLSIAAVAGADRQVIHTSVPAIITRLQKLGNLQGSKQLTLALGLPLRNTESLTNLLQQLYDPASTNFHRFLKPEDFAQRFGPTAHDYDVLLTFAETNHLKIVRKYGNHVVVGVVGKVSDIERTFHVTLGMYLHPEENREFYGPNVEPSVDLSLPLLYVSGLDNYVVPRPLSTRAAPFPHGARPLGNNGSGSNGTYLGSDFRHAYVPDTMLSGTGQVAGLVEFDGFDPNDIQIYENLAGLPNVRLQALSCDFPGPPYPAGPNNIEVAGDIEMIISMAPGISQVNVYEAMNSIGNFPLILNEIAFPTQFEPLPSVISCSWFGGNAFIGFYPTSALWELAVQGQSFFQASGDTGAYPTSTDPANYVESFMTVVGGTELSMNGSGVSWQSETVWNTDDSHDSGGGYFINVSIPDYQSGVNMSINQGSTQWRNVPDVAMCADQIEVVATVWPSSGGIMPGQILDYTGTSFATPLWAGFTALVNQQAISQGKPLVGFLNPAIYQIGKGPAYASCFHDVTRGNNTNANSGNYFRAAIGYDLCTGWGSPRGQNLIDALVNLAGPVFVDFNYTGTEQDGTYEFPFPTLAAGANAVRAFGTICIKTAGSSPETIYLSKPMIIIANDGPGTIGR